MCGCQQAPPPPPPAPPVQVSDNTPQAPAQQPETD